MSNLIGGAFGPSSFAPAVSESASRSTRMTLRPLSTSAREMARPSPPAAPVTTAFWSNVGFIESFLSEVMFWSGRRPSAVDRQGRAGDVGACGTTQENHEVAHRAEFDKTPAGLPL